MAVVVTGHDGGKGPYAKHQLHMPLGRRKVVQVVIQEQPYRLVVAGMVFEYVVLQQCSIHQHHHESHEMVPVQTNLLLVNLVMVYVVPGAFP